MEVEVCGQWGEEVGFQRPHLEWAQDPVIYQLHPTKAVTAARYPVSTASDGGNTRVQPYLWLDTQ